MLSRQALPIFGRPRPCLALAVAVALAPTRTTARVRGPPYQAHRARARYLSQEAVQYATIEPELRLWQAKRADIGKKTQKTHKKAKARGSTDRQPLQKSQTKKRKAEKQERQRKKSRKQKQEHERLHSSRQQSQHELARTLPPLDPDALLFQDSRDIALQLVKECPSLTKIIPNNASKHLQARIDSVGPPHTVRFTTEEQQGPQGESGTFAQVSVLLSGYANYVGKGWGRNQSQALHAASVRAMAEMHQDGLLTTLWPDIYSDRLSALTPKNITDMYEHCAKYLVTPEVTTETLQAALTRQPKHYIRCVMKAQQLNIDVSAQCKDGAHALSLAAKRVTAAVSSCDATEHALAAKYLTVAKAEDFIRFLSNTGKIRSQRRGPQLTEGPNSFQASFMDGPTVVGVRKKDAEQLAMLATVVSQVRESPTLLDDFAKAWEENEGKIVRKPAPLLLECDQRHDNLLRRVVQEGHQLTSVDLISVGKYVNDAQTSRPRISVTPETKERVSQSLLKMYQRCLVDDGMAKMRAMRADLPMNHHKEDVLTLVHNNIYSIIIGATGSGKTTQVPQIILEDAYLKGNGADCEIICTQPRRIAATSVATRVAHEMGPELGSNHVGHQVRFSSRPPREPHGSVTYCTTGILLQRLQSEADRLFDEVSHIIIDEVHERDKIIDFTLSFLKKAVAARLLQGKKVPHIVLMSATLDTQLFANYFTLRSETGEEKKTPILSVPGRAFPVTCQYLDGILPELRKNYSASELAVLNGDRDSVDYLKFESRFALARKNRPNEMGIPDHQKDAHDESDPDDDGQGLIPCGLVTAAIAHLAKTTQDGAILVFFPGFQEMKKVEEMMRRRPLGIDLTDPTRFKTFVLHSSIPDTQKTVFDPLPAGMRKIILSTNIGETSITVPEVKYVIDTGKLRETHYDYKTRVSSLKCVWISQSNAKQRAGRAGRVQDGHYIALYCEDRHQSLRAVGLPELLRSDLQATCLDIKASLRETDIRSFLAYSIEPPDPAAVDHAVKTLKDLGALTADEKLTPLGGLLASLPVQPGLGKMIVFGLLFRCLDPILINGVAAEERNLFVQAPDARKQSAEIKREFSGGLPSDHIATYNAFSAIRDTYLSQGELAAKRDACDNNIHFGAWKTIFNAAKQTEEVLVDQGLIEPRPRANLGMTRRPGPSEEPVMFGGADVNVHSGRAHVVTAILMAGLMPNNIAVSKPRGNKSQLFQTRFSHFTLVPRTSAVTEENIFQYQPRSAREQILATYTSLAESDGGFFFRETSVIPHPMPLALFADKLEAVGEAGNILEANEFWPMYVRTAPGQPWRPLLPRIIDARAAVEKLEKNSFAALARGWPLHKDPKITKTADAVVALLDWSASMAEQSSKPVMERDGAAAASMGWGEPGPRERSDFFQDSSRSHRPLRESGVGDRNWGRGFQDDRVPRTSGRGDRNWGFDRRDQRFLRR